MQDLLLIALISALLNASKVLIQSRDRILNHLVDSGFDIHFLGVLCDVALV